MTKEQALVILKTPNAIKVHGAKLLALALKAISPIQLPEAP